MDNKNILKIMQIVFALLFVVVIFFLVKRFNFNKEETDEIEFLKNYEINEYVPTYISEDQMARIYLSDYINNMFFYPKDAFALLDEGYSIKRFNTYNDFLTYVESLNYTTFSMDRYATYTKNGNRYFDIYDENGLRYIFKVNGVMEYSVFLDGTTIEI